MWPLLVVLRKPLFGLLSHFVQTLKHVHVEHRLAIAAIESFNETILHRLARFDELEHHSMLFGPFSQGQRDELRTVVCSERTTRSAVRLKSTVMASASRLKSSTTLKVRKRRPSHNASLMKSADQHSFIV